MANGTGVTQLYARAESEAVRAAIQMGQQLGQPRSRWEVPTEGWECPQCNERLRWEADEEDDYGHKYAADRLQFCRCQREAAERAREAYIQEKWPEAVESQWQACRIPARWRSATFDNFERRPGTEQAIAACQRYARTFEPGQTDVGLYLVGQYGVGKTHLAVATARAIVERTLISVQFYSVLGLLTDIKASFNIRDLEDRPDLLAEARQAELLILDDLGQELATDFDRAVIFGLINYRYEERLPTIYTSNLGDQQLKERLGGALVSRLWEACDVVKVAGDDYRALMARRRMVS